MPRGVVGGFDGEVADGECDCAEEQEVGGVGVRVGQDDSQRRHVPDGGKNDDASLRVVVNHLPPERDRKPGHAAAEARDENELRGRAHDTSFIHLHRCERHHADADVV